MTLRALNPDNKVVSVRTDAEGRLLTSGSGGGGGSDFDPNDSVQNINTSGAGPDLDLSAVTFTQDTLIRTVIDPTDPPQSLILPAAFLDANDGFAFTLRIENQGPSVADLTGLWGDFNLAGPASMGADGNALMVRIEAVGGNLYAYDMTAKLGAEVVEETTSGDIDLGTLRDGEVRFLHINAAVTSVAWPAPPVGRAIRATVLIEAVGANRDIADFLADNGFDYSGLVDTTVTQDFFCQLDCIFTENTRFVRFTTEVGGAPL